MVFFAVFAVVFVMFVIKSLTSVTSVGDLRGGAGVNSTQQVKYILLTPVGYAKTLLKFLKDYLSIPTTRQYISFFAYLGHGKTAYIFLALLGISVLFDKGENNSFKGSVWISILSVLMFVGMAGLIATALYISFTPVGYDGINGCQPRYLIPLLAPMALTVANPGIRVFKSTAVINKVVLILATAALFFDLCYVVAIPMM